MISFEETGLGARLFAGEGAAFFAGVALTAFLSAFFSEALAIMNKERGGGGEGNGGAQEKAEEEIPAGAGRRE